MISTLKKYYKKIFPDRWREPISRFFDNIRVQYAFFMMRTVLYTFVFTRWRNQLRGSAKTVLFYPEKPGVEYAVFKIFYILGWRISGDPIVHIDLAVNWEDCTWRTRDNVLEQLDQTIGCLNINCVDISKERVQSVFEEVTGYPLAVDPLTFKGKCVQKSNINASHDGVVIECPIEKREEHYVYERLVNNQFDDLYIEDIRVTVMKNTIALVCLKYRFKVNRFRNYRKAVIVKPTDVFSQQEQEQIITFCQKIGLDLGDLDILRDRDDGRMYIIDVNTTPAGPPGYIPATEYRRALKILTASFEEAVLPKK